MVDFSKLRKRKTPAEPEGSFLTAQRSAKAVDQLLVDARSLQAAGVEPARLNLLDSGQDAMFDEKTVDAIVEAAGEHSAPLRGPDGFTVGEVCSIKADVTPTLSGFAIDPDSVTAGSYPVDEKVIDAQVPGVVADRRRALDHLGPKAAQPVSTPSVDTPLYYDSWDEVGVSEQSASADQQYS